MSELVQSLNPLNALAATPNLANFQAASRPSSMAAHKPSTTPQLCLLSELRKEHDVEVKVWGALAVSASALLGLSFWL